MFANESYVIGHLLQFTGIKNSCAQFELYINFVRKQQKKIKYMQTGIGLVPNYT